jgi:hypothetical protein
MRVTAVVDTQNRRYCGQMTEREQVTGQSAA